MINSVITGAVLFSKLFSSVVDEIDSTGDVFVIFKLLLSVSILKLQSEVELTQSDEEDLQ